MDWQVMKYAAASVALVGATFLAYHGTEGWGWLIFAAIMVAGS